MPLVWRKIRAKCKKGCSVITDVQRVVAQAALQLLDDHPKHTAPAEVNWREAPPTGR
jgi:hypothetical protein